MKFIFHRVSLLDSIIIAGAKLCDNTLDKRAELRDSIDDCINIIGPFRCLQIICSRLQELSLGSSVSGGAVVVQWHIIEALLFASQMIPAHINSEESSVLFLQLLSALPSLPDLKGFKTTIFSLVRNSARLLKQNTQYLSTLLPPLVQSLADPDLCTLLLCNNVVILLMHQISDICIILIFVVIGGSVGSAGVVVIVVIVVVNNIVSLLPCRRISFVCNSRCIFFMCSLTRIAQYSIV